MATKKADTTTAHDDFKTMPSSMPDETTTTQQPRPVVAEAPQPDALTAKPQEGITGYRALNADEVRRINTIKDLENAFVSNLKTLRDAYHDAETQRMFAVSITNVETASMWAVRAITHRG